MTILPKLTKFFFLSLLLLNHHLSLALETTTPEPLKKIQMRGNTAYSHLGWPIRSAGDINKDGYADVIIGSNNLGTVYVIYGGPTTSLSNADLSNLSPLTGFKITGKTPGDYFGISVSGAGDINNDGYDDLLIGATDGFSQGAAYLIYGGPKSKMGDIDLSATTLDPRTNGFSIGNAGSDSFGISVSSAGDFNKDGYADVIIGARSKNSAQGAAYVVYGGEKSKMQNIDLASQTLDPLTTGFIITGNALGDYFGSSVSSAGDVNQDGYADIIVGAYSMGGSGAAYVIYGGPKSSMTDLDLSGTTLDPLTTGFMIVGSALNDYFGWSVSSAGDINKDGYTDIIVGALMSNGGKGGAYVIYGGEKSSMSNIVLSSQTLDPLTTGFMIIGSAPSEYLGASVGSAGDINQDGYNDIAIGALRSNGGKGGVVVIYGGEKSSLQNIDLSSGSLERGFSISGTSASDQAGISVDSGDINNDGGSDLLIGADGENNFAGTAYVLMYHFCSTNCKICSSPKTCTVCLMPYLLDSDQCVATCPSKTFSSNGACQSCPAECSKCTGLSACQGCIEGYSLTESQCVKDSAGEKAAAGAFEGVSIVGASLGSGSSLPLNFGLVAKILRNIKYMKLPVSQDLYETFVSWKAASGFMSAPGSWKDKYSSKVLPDVFSRYELQAAFLINFWKPLSMALIGIAIFGAFKAIEVSASKKRNKVYEISKQINGAASNFALTQFYSNLDDVLFYFILEMRSTKFETGFRVCSSLLALVLLLVGGIFLVMHSKILGRYQKIKEVNSTPQLKDFVSRFANINLIFKDFKDTNSLTQSFLMINVGRSVISSLIIATLFEYPMIQISFLIVLNLLMLVYLWNSKSFQEFTNTCGQIFCETILFIANICVFLLALFDHADSHPTSSIERLSKCIVVLNFMLLFGCIILLLVSLGKMLYQVYKDRKKAKQGPPPQKIDKIFTSAKFNRLDPGLTQSGQSISTTTGFVNNQPDLYQNTLKVPVENGILQHQEEISYNNSLSLPPQMDSFDISNSNIIFQADHTQDFADTSQSNLFLNHRSPRPRILRNRQKLESFKPQK